MLDNIPQVPLYSIAVGLSVFTFSLYLYSLYSGFRAYQQDREEGAETPTDGSALLGIIRPLARFFGHLISSALNRLRAKYGDEGLIRQLTRWRVAIQRSLVKAGNPDNLSADEMLGVGCVSILIWTLLGGLLGLAGEMFFPLFVAFIVGAVHPWLWLRKKITQRQNEMRRLLPYALDLLTLSVEAGLDFTAALDRIVPKLGDSALAVEFRETLRKIRLGRSRADALREMAGRVDMPEMTTFCNSLLQAEELGADLGPVLRLLADQTREDRSNRAEKKAMEAPVKILFPLIAFIFPTVFIILFAPVGINYLQQIFGW
ncbi:MAG: type II secretion system F family protein [Candidatus Brocadiia bacterium]